MKRPISIYRAISQTFPPEEMSWFANFLKKTRHIFRNIKRHGGDIAYVFAVLDIIWGEEVCWWDYRAHNTEEASHRGPRPEWQSDLAMYLLYRHFKLIKLKRINESIADIVNEFSSKSYRPITGAQLSPENVRKRIQWLKKQKDILKMALDWKEDWKKGDKSSIVLSSLQSQWPE